MIFTGYTRTKSVMRSARSTCRTRTGSEGRFEELTALTGARTPVIWFKICPVLLITSAALLVAASLL